MFPLVWISFLGLIHAGCGLGHQTRYERTRYVSSRNQIYGENFDFNEKYIPFVHYWERPLQILESSMKIPKKLSSRPLFSWDFPVQISTYTPSKKVSTTENSLNLLTETTAPPQQREPPPTPKTAHKSRSDRARASAVYSFPLIPIKQKKSANRKKSIQEMEPWKQPDAGPPAAPRADARLKKKKKLKKSRKGKQDKNGRGRKPLPGRSGVPRGGCDASKCEHRCEGGDGGGVCVCFRGFVLRGGRCVDVDECEREDGGCNGRCVNTIGSRRCVCSAGFRLVDGSCADVNECLLRNGHGPCQDRCTNTMGSYTCSCEGLPGTTLSADNHTCENARSCDPTAAGCSHSCVSVTGTAFCTCPDGMELGADWKTCHDIDECASPEDYGVRCEWGCVNTVGSYVCAASEGERSA